MLSPCMLRLVVHACDVYLPCLTHSARLMQLTSVSQRNRSVLHGVLRALPCLSKPGGTLHDTDEAQPIGHTVWCIGTKAEIA
jgi:hypothetical protein